MFNQFGLAWIPLHHPTELCKQFMQLISLLVTHLWFATIPIACQDFLLRLRVCHFLSKVAHTCGDVPPPEHIDVEPPLPLSLVVHINKIVHSTHCTNNPVWSLPLRYQL